MHVVFFALSMEPREFLEEYVWMTCWDKENLT